MRLSDFQFYLRVDSKGRRSCGYGAKKLRLKGPRLLRELPYVYVVQREVMSRFP